MVTIDGDRVLRYAREGHADRSVVFSGNVVARYPNSTHYADRMEVHLDPTGQNIRRTVSMGHVRIVTRYGDEARGGRADCDDTRHIAVLRDGVRVRHGRSVVLSGDCVVLELQSSTAATCFHESEWHAGGFESAHPR